MAEEELALFQDVFFNSTAIKLENNEDSFPLFDLTYFDGKFHFEFQLFHQSV